MNQGQGAERLHLLPTCARCGGTFAHKGVRQLGPQGAREVAVYCGVECRTAETQARRRRVCAHRPCGREFFAAKAHSKTRFCSHSCAHVARKAETSAGRERRACPQCADVFEVEEKRNDQIFCGAGCYHASKKGKLSDGLRKGQATHTARGIERRTRRCEECDGSYVLAVGSWWDGERRARFCSDDCRVQSAARKIGLLRAEGRPIIEIYNTYILCLVCGKKFEQAGSHFSKVHGLGTTKETGHFDRQIAYGTPAGARMASRELMRFFRESAIDRRAIEGFGDKRNLGGNPPPRAGRARPAPSTRQRIAGALVQPLGARARKEKARRVGTCTQCGVRVEYRRGAKTGRRIFCGQPCSTRWLHDHHHELISKEQRAAAAAKAVATRKRNGTPGSRSGPAWHKTITCAGCDKPRVVARSSKKKYCSKQCYLHHRWYGGADAHA